MGLLFIKALDAIHHEGLQIYTGVVWTRHVDSLEVVANEPPLDLRRIKFILQYTVKLKDNWDNPAFDSVFHPQFEDLYDKNKKSIKSIGLQVQKNIHNSNLPFDIIKPTTTIKIDKNPTKTRHCLNTRTPSFASNNYPNENSKHSAIVIYTEISKDENKIVDPAVIEVFLHDNVYRQSKGYTTYFSVY